MKNRLILGVGLIVLLGGLLHYCNRPTIRPTKPDALLPTEKEHVSINSESDTLEVITPTEHKVISGIRHTEISIGKDGSVKVTAHPYGFSCTPGIGASYRTRLGEEGDIEWYYYHRLGAHVGIYHDTDVRAFLGVSYNLSRIKLSNTSLMLGLDNHKDLLGLVTVRL